MTKYYRPILQTDTDRTGGSYNLAGGWCWFNQLEVIDRNGPAEQIPAKELPAHVLEYLTAPRPPIAGLGMGQPRLMGILNTTPDSFSDGGKYDTTETGVVHALQLIKDGADIIDIGGESTRPGAEVIAEDQEISRTVPVIEAIRANSPIPVSIDTRKAGVAGAAINAGANIVNDVSALSFDAQLAELVAKSDVPVCLMHAQGDPATMQKDPHYENVLLDVYDTLAERITIATAAGIRRENIIIDPGIGFGKTLEHNLTLIRNIALFHTLGCPILLGTSRKRFIGTLSGTSDAHARMPGSIATALAGISQGVQITRVHDIAETRQALTLWSAVTGMRQK